VLDIGCGRDAWLLSSLANQYQQGIGIDPVAVVPAHPYDNLTFHRGFADQMPLPDASVDVVFCQSVLEHLETPDRVFAEVARVMRPGARWLILTPNLWDYASLIAWVVPNRWHGRVVAAIEGRDEVDTFPTFFRANTAGAIRRLAARHQLAVRSIDYWGQYPGYLTFHPIPFLIGSAYAQLTMRVGALAPLRGWLAVDLERRARSS
jgi:SAM-dependent methyltransferase